MANDSNMTCCCRTGTPLPGRASVPDFAWQGPARWIFWSTARVLGYDGDNPRVNTQILIREAPPWVWTIAHECDAAGPTRITYSAEASAERLIGIIGRLSGLLFGQAPTTRQLESS